MSRFKLVAVKLINYRQDKLEINRTEVLSNEIEGETGENTRENKVTSVNATRYEIPSDKIETLDIASKRALQLEIFSYFIQTGNLPRWSPRLSKQELEKSCDRLITTSPNQIKYLVEQSLKNDLQLQRIIYQFSDATLLKITKLLAGELYQFLADYHTVLKGIFNQLENLINIPETKFRLETWRGIFFSFSFPSNTKADKFRLIQESLLHIATSLPIEYPQVLSRIIPRIESLKREGIQFKSTLPELLVKRVSTRGRDILAVRRC